MKSIEINNLRSISDTGEILMRPLMILVGANSSGKSTFLRTFPLFKQSIETRKRGPLLWYGPEVDFGSFDTAITRGERIMRFVFKFDCESRNKTKGRSVFGDPIIQSVRIEISSSDYHDYISALVLTLFDGQIIEVIRPTKQDCRISINGRDFSNDTDIAVQFYEHYGIIPSCYLRSKEESKSIKEIIVRRINKELNTSFSAVIDQSLMERALSDSKIMDDESLKALKLEAVIPDEGQRSIVQSFIKDTVLFSLIDDVIENANMLLRFDFESVSYIKPLRASAERYYRVQNLSVDELASDGHNMAMFLNELYTNPRDKEAFQEWTKDNFRFIVDTHEENGHVSIKVKDEKNTDFDNIADSGSGYAQLLPILILLWNASARGSKELRLRRSMYGHRYLAIEQPELHLHPEVQVRFADVVATMMKSSRKNNVHFIIETHSKDFINRIGGNIERGLISPGDVSILLFDSDHRVRTAAFNADGVLQNWPIGFFDPF